MYGHFVQLNHAVVTQIVHKPVHGFQLVLHYGGFQLIDILYIQ